MNRKTHLKVARELRFKALNKILLEKLFISNPDLPPLRCISVTQDGNDGLLISTPACREKEEEIPIYKAKLNMIR